MALNSKKFSYTLMKNSKLYQKIDSILQNGNSTVKLTDGHRYRILKRGSNMRLIRIKNEKNEEK